jgi:hypothetical protein
MKKLLLGFALLLAGCNERGGFATAPTNQQAMIAIEEYVKTNNYCDGILEIKKLGVINVDSYESTMSGWRATAVLVATCRAKNSSVQYMIANNQQNNPFEIYIKDLGKNQYKAFIPDEMQRTMHDQMKKAMDRIRIR